MSATASIFRQRRFSMLVELAWIVLLVSVAGPGCGGNAPTAPTLLSAVTPSATTSCQAINYPGATGGERIQGAVNDHACTTVYVSSTGPDEGGVWLIRRPIQLRSDLILTDAGGSELPILQAQTSAILVADGQSNVMIRRLSLQGAKVAGTGLLIRGSSQITFTLGAIAGMTNIGVYLWETPSSDITISSSRFQDNNYIDVRTETSDPAAYHSNVKVENNSMLATTYSVAFANCGHSQGTACQARNNIMKPKSAFPGTGVDLNRSHWAVVSANRISGAGDACSSSPVVCKCGRGITVDDTQNATISANFIDGCSEEGILLANGAVAGNRPWWVSGNTISGNTVQNCRAAALASYRDDRDPDDHNIFNVFSNNHLTGNAEGCRTNAERGTFFGNGPQVCPPKTGS